MSHPQLRRPRAGIAVASALTVMGATVVLAPGATAELAPGEIAQTQGLRKAVTVAGIREHQAALQAISDANGGNRVAGCAGYARPPPTTSSSDCRRPATPSAGSPFEFVFNADATPPVFTQVSPSPTTYVDGAGLRVDDLLAQRRRHRGRCGRRPDSAAVAGARHAPRAARRPTSPASRPAPSRWSSGAPARSHRRPTTPWPRARRPHRDLQRGSARPHRRRGGHPRRPRRTTRRLGTTSRSATTSPTAS